MKTGLFLLCVLCATTALAQSGGAALSSEVQVFQMPSHEHRATQQTMAQEQSLYLRILIFCLSRVSGLFGKCNRCLPKYLLEISHAS